MKQLHFDVALSIEGSQWVATILGPFITAQGPTKEDALEALRELYRVMAMASNGPMKFALAERERTPPEYKKNAKEIVQIALPSYSTIY